MKKAYETPAMDMIVLLASDVLTLSEGSDMGDGDINSIIFGDEGNINFSDFS